MPEWAEIWLKVVWWCKYSSICKIANTDICTNKPLLSFPPRHPRQAENLSGTWRGEQKASSRLMMTATQKVLVFSEGGCIIYFAAAASALHWAGGNHGNRLLGDSGARVSGPSASQNQERLAQSKILKLARHAAFWRLLMSVGGKWKVRAARIVKFVRRNSRLNCWHPFQASAPARMKY